MPATNSVPPSMDEDRRLVVGEEVQLVLEVLDRHVVARRPRLRGDVVGGRVEAGRARQPVALGIVGEPLERRLVLEDPLDRDRLAQLLRVVVVGIGRCRHRTEDQRTAHHNSSDDRA